MRALFCVLWLAGAGYSEPVIVPAREWGSRPLPLSEELRHVPEKLVVHHAGVLWKPGDDPVVKLRNLQAWGQREKSWPDLPYHYLISPDGRIFEGRDWRYRPESNTRYSLNGVINVHLFGNFDEQAVSRPQLVSLVELLASLRRRHGLEAEAVSSHRLEAPGQTTCPGADLQRYLNADVPAWTAALLDGVEPVIELWTPWFRALPPVSGPQKDASR